MKVEKDCIVQFHYQLADEQNNVLEDSRKGEALACLQGHGNIFPKLEEALLGKSSGDTVVVTLAPEEAYGIRNNDGLRRISRKHIQHKGKLQAGMIVNIKTDQGQRQVVVNKVGKFVVDIDANHPMAGMTLTFTIEIVDVRAASAEELSHGHAHGQGGHQH